MRKEIIDSYIDQLLASLGKIRVSVDEEELFRLYKARDFSSLIRHVARTMHVNCVIDTELVTRHDLANTPAFISMPVSMPIYGSQAFKQTRVKISFQERFVTDAPFEGIVYAISHEISHVVLDSIHHPLRREEVAVDLTAMLLGYRDFCVTGCQHTVINENQEYAVAHAYGYLELNEILYASTYMTFGK